MLGCQRQRKQDLILDQISYRHVRFRPQIVDLIGLVFRFRNGSLVTHDYKRRVRIQVVVHRTQTTLAKQMQLAAYLQFQARLVTAILITRQPEFQSAFIGTQKISQPQKLRNRDCIMNFKRFSRKVEVVDSDAVTG